MDRPRHVSTAGRFQFSILPSFVLPGDKSGTVSCTSCKIRTRPYVLLSGYLDLRFLELVADRCSVISTEVPQYGQNRSVYSGFDRVDSRIKECLKSGSAPRRAERT